MVSPVIQKLTKEDVKVAAALKSVVLQGKFEMKGDAVALAGSLFRWLDNLDKRIEETLKPAPQPAVDPIKIEEAPKKGKK